MKPILKMTALAAVLSAAAPIAQAFTFEGESISGNFDSSITAGVGVRRGRAPCDSIVSSFIGDPAAPSAGSPTACAEGLSGINDQGNLNYRRGDPFTTYLKGSHELLLKLPEDVKFMARVNWLRDFTATHTSGYLSGLNASGQGLPQSSAEELRFKHRVLDFWVSKGFDLGDERARVRVGNQVVSWGESLFIPGGINQTNAMDFMRLSQPGTQLKEVFLPAPIASFATGLGRGLNLETYYQADWNANYFPPVGSYWSTASVGAGSEDYGLRTMKPKQTGQYGASLRWQPEGVPLNLGVYAMNYHDKSPVFSYQAGGAMQYDFLPDRKMYGVSANFPLGNWAIGAEVSYRPRDAVSLNTNGADANGAPCGAAGQCWAESAKYQTHLTALLSLTPSDHAPLLNLLGASTGTLLAEAVAVTYPDLQQSYNGVPVAAGLWGWGFARAGNMGPAVPVGTRNSWGYNVDFSWVYDGTVVPGWQVIPEIYYFQAVKGYTPNIMGTFQEGAKSANLILTLTQNPATWSLGVNYAKFWGPDSLTQPLKGRDFVGAFVTRNF